MLLLYCRRAGAAKKKRKKKNTQKGLFVKCLCGGGDSVGLSVVRGAWTENCSEIHTSASDREMDKGRLTVSCRAAGSESLTSDWTAPRLCLGHIWPLSHYLKRPFFCKFGILMFAHISSRFRMLQTPDVWRPKYKRVPAVELRFSSSTHVIASTGRIRPITQLDWLDLLKSNPLIWACETDVSDLFHVRS